MEIDWIVSRAVLHNERTIYVDIDVKGLFQEIYMEENVELWYAGISEVKN
jgi:hypothetical protein